MQIKLITYNIWHGKYLDKVIEFIKSEKPDVICLQEIGTSGQEMEAKQINLFEEIGKNLGMGGVYESMFRGNEGRGEYDFGVAIYSHLIIKEKKTWAYERETEEILFGGGKDRYKIPRKLLGVKIALNTSIWVFTAHHTITPNGGVTEHQLRQTRKVKEFLKPFDQYIFCGDMNTPYRNENYDLLSQGLTDLSNPKEPTLHPTIHPVGNLGYHVDYVFSKGERFKHIATRVPLVDASDHLPVVVELEIL